MVITHGIEVHVEDNMKAGSHVFNLCVKDIFLFSFSLLSPCCGRTMAMGFVDS